MRENEKADLLKQLALLLRAGLPLSRCIDILSEGRRRNILLKIQAELQKGQPLSQAFDWGEQSGALIALGEQNGILEEALERAARQIEERARFKEKIKKALSYPALVLVLSLICLVLVSVLILPSFAGLYSDLGHKMPALTIFALSLSRVWFLIPMALLLFIFAASRFFISDIRYALSFFKYAYLEGFCRSLGELLRGGVPILQAFDILLGATPSELLKGELSRARLGLERGEKLNSALGRFFPQELKRMLMVGEEADALESILLSAAELYREKSEALLKKFTLLIEPASTLLVGCFVGFIALAMLMPLFTLMNSLL